ncbi:serine/threonine protein kinase [Pyxidicoccus sp. MSG2]|uniref:serine/threonine protein kinase n=1 Tax=Pyxidicoccus sp. MSG2 TaxID=2996790 RepID=UPI00226EC22B|nr:serine/threonine-protein kinase [Pyxidicoccus sp. MSG2]MCY1023530.1 serine/threonine-protein kinase [Pyxidicoccus sp. MSG2]
MERRGWGAYGAVYRAFRVEGVPGPVALKLALHPGDERFAREGELLSRIRHPSVPRLVARGSWRQPGDILSTPYIAMEWIEGVSLYEWARVQCPSSRQVLHALASLARALEATHAAGGVHRDVKGDNVLVSAADGQVFLTDFGSGHYLGAATLTSPPFPPGTPHYRSPEAWRSVRLPFQASAPPYAPGPADDVFALGMTAYRLVTDDYPPTPAPMDEESHIWRPEGPGPRPLHAVNVRCCEELSGLVCRMISVHPEARGSARELAEALEQAARRAGPKADVPLFAREEPQPVDARGAPRHVVPRAAGHTARSWLTAASLGGAVVLGAAWLLSAHPGEEAAQGHASAPEDEKDGGTVAVGDTALTAPVSPRAPSAWSAISVDVPPRPLPGQQRVDTSGRCPSRTQVPINGGCWTKLAVSMKDCDASFNYYEYKGACYGPALPPARPSTSGPAEHSEYDTP